MIYSDAWGKLGKLSGKFLARKEAFFPPERRVVSFTFDDFPVSAIENGARILEERGVRGTFYAALGVPEDGSGPTNAEMLGVAEAGHEVGCHTHRHLDCSATPVDELLRDCEESQRVAREMSGLTMRSFAYPYGAFRPAAKRVVGNLYDTARTVTEGVNVGRIDLAALSGAAVFGDEVSDSVRSRVRELSQGGGWLIFYTHEVTEKALEWGCSIDTFARVVDLCLERGFEIRTVGSAAELCRELPRAAALVGL